MILQQAYGFTEENTDVMAAPQARAMVATIEPIMTGGDAPWAYYGIGAALAIILDRLGISALAFALGMFIPLHLNLPLVVGGSINHFVTHRGNDSALSNARSERGTLIASGFIAGGALMGVVSAGLQFFNVNLVIPGWAESGSGQLLSLVMYILLIVFFVSTCMKVKK